MALWYRIQPDPFKEMGRIQREMNKMFDSVDNSENRLIPSSDSPVERFWSPSIDVREDDNALTFHAEIPGLKDEEVHVEMKDGSLCISGERKFEKKEDNEKYHRVERSYGRFERRFPLPRGVDPGSITATTDKGVLEVVVPKPKGSESSKIPVTTRSS